MDKSIASPFFDSRCITVTVKTRSRNFVNAFCFRRSMGQLSATALDDQTKRYVDGC